jgi:hypothetical protein
VADIQIFARQPDIDLDSDTSDFKGRKQRSGAPIVVVGVAWNLLQTLGAVQRTV